MTSCRRPAEEWEDGADWPPVVSLSIRTCCWSSATAPAAPSCKARRPLSSVMACCIWRSICRTSPSVVIATRGDHVEVLRRPVRRAVPGHEVLPTVPDKVPSSCLFLILLVLLVQHPGSNTSAARGDSTTPALNSWSTNDASTSTSWKHSPRRVRPLPARGTRTTLGVHTTAPRARKRGVPRRELQASAHNRAPLPCYARSRVGRRIFLSQRGSAQASIGLNYTRKVSTASLAKCLASWPLLGLMLVSPNPTKCNARG